MIDRDSSSIGMAYQSTLSSAHTEQTSFFTCQESLSPTFNLFKMQSINFVSKWKHTVSSGKIQLFGAVFTAIQRKLSKKMLCERGNQATRRKKAWKIENERPIRWKFFLFSYGKCMDGERTNEEVIVDCRKLFSTSSSELWKLTELNELLIQVSSVNPTFVKCNKDRWVLASCQPTFIKEMERKTLFGSHSS